MKTSSTIAVGQSLEGQLRGEGDVRVNGAFCGAIDILGVLIVGPEALVQAEVNARAVRVEGSLEGHVRVEHDVQITPTGRLAGTVEGRLIVEEGGRFIGQPTALRLTRFAPPQDAEEPSAPPGVAEALPPSQEPSNSPIRRLTEEDTVPPADQVAQHLSAVRAVRSGTRPQRDPLIPDTRKQPIERSPAPESPPLPLQRRRLLSTPPATTASAVLSNTAEELADAWFEDQDYLVDSQ